MSPSLARGQTVQGGGDVTPFLAPFGHPPPWCLIALLLPPQGLPGPAGPPGEAGKPGEQVSVGNHGRDVGPSLSPPHRPSPSQSWGLLMGSPPSAPQGDVHHIASPPGAVGTPALPHTPPPPGTVGPPPSPPAGVIPVPRVTPSRSDSAPSPSRTGCPRRRRCPRSRRCQGKLNPTRSSAGFRHPPGARHPP